MKRLLGLCTLILFAVPVQANNITGEYVEARTCDVWTGPCFANAEFNITGKNAVMAWHVKTGTFNNVSLKGLSIVAVISASDTLGLKQTGPSKAIVLIDSKATEQQRKALLTMAQQQSQGLLKHIIAVRRTPINLTICPCQGQTCADLKAGTARIKTRCLHKEHDKACGNESTFFPPLAKNVRARPAAAVEHTFRGTGLGEIWSDYGRRGAFVGTFSIR